jgi:hypothetical protein
MTGTMTGRRFLRLVALALAASAAPFLVAKAAPPADPTATPVLLELFTSESCNKCPPADSVLTLLVETQPVEGAHIVAIAPHVTWSPSRVPEWKDPFATPALEARHDGYAASLGRRDTYTPQVIVDGVSELPGQNYRRVTRAIARAAEQPKALAVSIEVVPAAAESLAFRISVRPQGAPPAAGAAATPPAGAEILLVLTEDGIMNHVTAGENAGRTLRHDRVVRSLVTAGRIEGDGAAATRTVSATVAAPAAWKRDRLTAVAFVQETASRRVLGVAERALR